MAEIKIEKKKPVWPWIIAILIVLGVLYYVFVYANNTNDDADLIDDTVEEVDDTTVYDTTDEETTTYGEINSENAVSEYTNYIDEAARMGVDPVYTNTAVIKLIEATQERSAALNMDVSSDLEQARAETTNITSTTSENNKASVVKKSGGHVANALQKLQQNKFPELAEEVENLKNVLAQINPELSLTEQKGEVTTFFGDSAEILAQLN